MQITRSASPRRSHHEVDVGSSGKPLPRWMGYASAAAAALSMPAAAAGAIIPIAPVTLSTLGEPGTYSLTTNRTYFNLTGYLSGYLSADSVVLFTDSRNGSFESQNFGFYPHDRFKFLSANSTNYFAVGDGTETGLDNAGRRTVPFPFTNNSYGGLRTNVIETLGITLGGQAAWIRILLSADPVTNRFTKFEILSGAYETSGAPILVGVEPLLGDISGNGKVDIGDFTLWTDSFGDMGVGLPADLSRDNQVDIGDFTIWVDNFGNTAGVGSSVQDIGTVPEPSTFALALLAAGALGVAALKRFRRESP